MVGGIQVLGLQIDISIDIEEKPQRDILNVPVYRFVRSGLLIIKGPRVVS